MIIQCPECKARYRTRVLSEDQSPLKVKCPKCDHRFLVGAGVAESDAKPQAKVTILLVDDARFFRELMLDLLKGRQAHLLTADNAKDAWDLLHKEKIDLIIVDINLPDKSGLDLIGEIRTVQALKNIRILCISGVYRKSDDAMMAIRAGADDFISKSFQPIELNERIDKLLAK